MQQKIEYALILLVFNLPEEAAVLIFSLVFMSYGLYSIVTKTSIVGKSRIPVKGKMAVIWGILLLIGGLLFLYGYFAYKS